MKRDDSRMPEILMVADDLTGALDSAVAFSGSGRAVLVARSIEAVPAVLNQRPDVAAINTASREIPPDQACARVGSAVAYFDLTRIARVMKKVDSRLKGNAGAEAAFLAQRRAAERVIVAPAIPDMGRKVKDGFLFGAGLDGELRVRDIFTQDVEIPDAMSDEDLDRIVTEPAENVLWVGARGLAGALARAEHGNCMAELPALPRPAFFANGSRDPLTVAQIAALGSKAEVIDAPDGFVPPVAQTGSLCVISISDGGGGLSGHAAGSRFADRIADELHRQRPATVLLSGGETANLVLDRLGIDILQIVAEFRPGVPLCRCDAPWGAIWLMTKSGGFGTWELLRDIAADILDGDNR